MGSGAELGPMGEFHVQVAALRSDRSDVESYARVLSETLGDALPSGMVEVERRRTLADRVGGRAGQPVALRIVTENRRLELSVGKHGGLKAEIHQAVRGVVIKRQEVDVEEWLTALADELTQLAARDAVARDALSRLFGS
ncbi:hypothetical protein [Amycolatopsis sp. H20-H5]|uniref:hypothetical protein n=1 Tax=Amycolatopsis sp. H20-H5 TaxID=3046309 RepID=UPI002DBF3751|nr:hypothetical protein [Amycolatopsis sp. H20-H5]MEC3975240.1 hypothetical protein [Amycolatopsis sp. H20-H5]